MPLNLESVRYRLYQASKFSGQPGAPPRPPVEGASSMQIYLMYSLVILSDAKWYNYTFFSFFLFIVFQPSGDCFYLMVWIRVWILVNAKSFFTLEVYPEIFSILDSSYFNPILIAWCHVVLDGSRTTLLKVFWEEACREYGMKSLVINLNVVWVLKVAASDVEPCHKVKVYLGSKRLLEDICLMDMVLVHTDWMRHKRYYVASCCNHLEGWDLEWWGIYGLCKDIHMMMWI